MDREIDRHWPSAADIDRSDEPKFHILMSNRHASQAAPAGMGHMVELLVLYLVLLRLCGDYS